MTKLLVVTSIFFALAAQAEEACVEGYRCEKTGPYENILRVTRLMTNENVTTCETETVANFGWNESECQKASVLLSKK